MRKKAIKFLKEKCPEHSINAETKEAYSHLHFDRIFEAGKVQGAR